MHKFSLYNGLVLGYTNYRDEIVYVHTQSTCNVPIIDEHIAGEVM